MPHTTFDFAFSEPPFQCELLRRLREHSEDIACNRRLADPTFASHRSRFHCPCHLTSNHITCAVKHITSDCFDYNWHPRLLSRNGRLADPTFASHRNRFHCKTQHVARHLTSNHIICAVKNTSRLIAFSNLQLHFPNNKAPPIATHDHLETTI